MIPSMGILLKRRARFASAMGIALALALSAIAPTSVHSDDIRADAQHLSDSSFAILNTLTSDSSKANAGDVIGAMASFAGDAQTLSAALAKSDNDAAGAAMTALVADRRAVDDALVRNPHAIDSSKWGPLKAELASIQSKVPASGGSMAKGAGGEPSSGVVKPPASEAAATVPDGSAPRVEITSRETDDTGLHLKGYLQGTNLKSAGIYDSDAMIQKIDLAPVPGAQRVLLDFKLEQVSSSETIRVEDASGRAAEVHIADNPTPAVESGAHEKMIELGGGAGAADAPPVELASRGPVNTAEIPIKSPSRRHIHSNDNLAPLTDVQINILAVQQSISEAEGYQVIGQIAGNNVHRAGIYIDGRLVKPIAVSPGSDTSFNVSFTMFGKEATIRAYGVGSNYVESSIDLSTANGAVYGSNPPVGVYSYPVNPYAVNPYTRNPYGYPTNPYGAPPPYGYPSGTYPNGYPPNGYPNGAYAPPARPWWSKIF
jgi:hypothetical protein